MEKIRVAIDTSYMDRRPGKGTAIVIRHSVEELLRCRDQFDITLVHKQAIPEDPLYRDFKEIIIPKISLPKFSGFFSELFFFLTTKERFDVYYFSYSRLYPTFWLAPGKRIVWAAMDGGPKTAGYTGTAKEPAPWHVRLFLGRVDAFVALSEFGKRGIVANYGISPEKVHVIYNGVDARFFHTFSSEEIGRRLAAYRINQPYLLCVSRFDPHKNILRLIDAYKAARDKNANTPELLFVGGRHLPDYSDQVEEHIERLGLSGVVTTAPYISDEDMPAVYAGAQLAVFPSLYEGFGLPVVEAMASGTSLVISNIAALTEVASGNAVVVDPYSAISIAEGLQQVLHTGKSETAQEIARTWARQFTWKAHGEALARVLREVVRV